MIARLTLLAIVATGLLGCSKAEETSPPPEGAAPQTMAPPSDRPEK